LADGIVHVRESSLLAPTAQADMSEAEVAPASDLKRFDVARLAVGNGSVECVFVVAYPLNGWCRVLGSGFIPLNVRLSALHRWEGPIPDLIVRRLQAARDEHDRRNKRTEEN